MKLPQFSTKDLALYLPMNEGAGRTANDKTKYSNDGAITGAIWKGGKILGKCLSFDGTDDLVAIKSSSSIEISGQITVSAWIKATNFTNDYACVLSKVAAADGFGLEKPTGVNKLHFAIADGTDWQTAVTGTLSTGTWYHIAGSYDGTNIRIYVDSVLKDTTAHNPLTSTTNDMIIGRHATNTAADRFWTGEIDEVRVYDRVLSLDEIKRHYAAGKYVHGVKRRRRRV